MLGDASAESRLASKLDSTGSVDGSFLHPRPKASHARTRNAVNSLHFILDILIAKRYSCIGGLLNIDDPKLDICTPPFCAA